MNAQVRNDEVRRGSRTLLVIQAIFAIGVGIAFLANPKGMVSFLSQILGIILVIFGSIAVLNSYGNRKIHTYWKWLFQDGLLQLIVGLILVFWPQLTPKFIMILAGVWIILGGIIQLILANRYSLDSTQRNIRGLLAVIVGAVLLFNPDAGVAFFTRIVGLISLLYGIFLLYRVSKRNSSG